MARKSDLSVGDKVGFVRTHDKTTKLTGTISKIHKDDDIVEIDRDVDGKVVEVEGVEHAHAADVTVIETGKKSRAAKD